MSMTEKLTSIQQVFQAPWMIDTTKAIVFRLPKSHDNSYERNWKNIPNGRTDWWAVAEERRKEIDAIILLIDSKAEQGVIEIYSGRFSGQFETNANGGVALFAEGGFISVGTTSDTGLRTFYGKQPGNQFTYVLLDPVDRSAPVPPIAKLYAPFSPTFKKEFTGKKSSVLPRSYVPECNHAVAVNKLSEWLVAEGYTEIDNNPWDISALAPDKNRYLFELKPGAHPYLVFTAIGQLQVYSYEFELQHGLKHKRLVMVLPDGATARRRAHMLRQFGIDLLLFTQTHKFHWANL